MKILRFIFGFILLLIAIEEGSYGSVFAGSFGLNQLGVTMIGVAGVIAIVSLLLMATSFGNSKKQNEAGQMIRLNANSASNSPSTVSVQLENNTFIFCRYCGLKLPSDSKYCSKCGKSLSF